MTRSKECYNNEHYGCVDDTCKCACHVNLSDEGIHMHMYAPPNHTDGVRP